MSLEDAAALAVAAINIKSERKEGVQHIKMARITSEKKYLEKISKEDLEKYSQVVEQKFKQA